MFNILTHQGNTNKNHTEILFHPGQNGSNNENKC